MTPHKYNMGYELMTMAETQNYIRIYKVLLNNFQES